MSQRSGSVYGGAGGKGIRISSGRSSIMAGGFGSGGGAGGSFAAFSLDAGADPEGAFSSISEKLVMQSLNTRLAEYLEKVSVLEQANAKLEGQIKEWVLNRGTVATRDLTTHLKTIDEIRAKIQAAGTVVSELTLQLDNTKLSADNFRIKFESELCLRQSVEADISSLKRILVDLSLDKQGVEGQLENLKEELVYLKNNHEEETKEMRSQLSGQIHVEVDAAPAADLNAAIADIREQYEGLVAKNHRDVENWFKSKAEAVQQEMSVHTEHLQTSSVELKEVQTKGRDQELELQTLLAVKASLEGNLMEIEARYGALMVGLQASVVSLESQLTQIRADTQRSAQEYQALLDIKTRLEKEIAEYRRLLEGEDTGYAVTSAVESAVVDTETSASTEESEPLDDPSSSSITVTVVTVATEEVNRELVNSTTTVNAEEVNRELVNSTTTVNAEEVNRELVNSTTTVNTEEVNRELVNSTTTVNTEEVVLEA
ncbi:keratin, type I cytoskeletal 19-like [Centroberyx gerrardi]